MCYNVLYNHVGNFFLFYCLFISLSSFIIHSCFLHKSVLMKLPSVGWIKCSWTELNFIAEEQVGFGAGRSTTEQISNLRILCEQHLKHQQDLYQVFIDFKKAFDRVWHAALWTSMKKHNISANLNQVIKHLFDNTIIAVFFNGSIVNWFWTTVGVQQRCLLSSILFNIFLERIMTDALEDHEGTISIGGRTFTNLCVTDDMRRKKNWEK